MTDIYSNLDKHVVLSNNVKMPILGLGTSHNGGYSHDAVVYALKECGYRHIDTAKRYGCEELISQSIKSSGVKREDIFLATKCWPSDYGNDKIQAAFNGSAGRLQTNYLDLYMLHWPEVPTGYNRKALIEESWRALELLYDKEVARSIGVSNFLEHHLESLLEECSIIPHVDQCEFHPFNNPKNLRDFCSDNGILFEGYSPLAKGHLINQPFIRLLSEELNRTPAQILIRWSHQNGVPTIPKSTKIPRILENSKGHSPFANGEVFSDPVITSLVLQNSNIKNKPISDSTHPGENSSAYPLSPSKLILRWNIQNKVVCIPKSTKNNRVFENMEIFNFELNQSEMSILNNLPRKLSVMDWSSMQSKLDNPLPDGYKLKLPKALKTFPIS